MSRTYTPMDPVTREYRRTMFSQQRNNRRAVFKEQFNKLLEKQGKHYTLDALADKIDINRGTINNWKQGHSLPGKKNIQKIEKAFGVPGYFQLMDLHQQELADPEYHRKLNLSSAEYGNHIGICESFVRFLRDIPQLADTIGHLQPTDAVLNSFDRRVLNMNLTYQFANLSGERFYINEYMINVLRVLQNDVEEFITEKLKEYDPIIDTEFHERKELFNGSYPDGYFWRKARIIEHNKRKGTSEKSVPENNIQP